ncbi:hypothetical protein HMPREF0290_2734 [Corynebacterium efficiens YS-314]|uniref:Uncharacterized protein n=1 Tax=Corynebacterium efficiens (strain DSM 44549 / YS-314 / AJ 12310 / JCM 11189 / NBRC 100395) TaxID=196164 RepID=Q8FSU6_COREF|nr:hypothetical protein HMPREF0290_2734 [Corynebacterium efficiens YS-314]BAC19758.1 hypothetical protein [Corynebacterium efficiens YS-314]
MAPTTGTTPQFESSKLCWVIVPRNRAVAEVVTTAVSAREVRRTGVSGDLTNKILGVF